MTLTGYKRLKMRVLNAVGIYRNVYRDVVTMSGTHPALQLIKGWVERQQVDGKEAADIITAFPSHVFSPTMYLVQDFFVSIVSFIFWYFS